MNDRIAHFDNGQWHLMGELPEVSDWSFMHMVIYYGVIAFLILFGLILLRAGIRVVPEYARLVVFRLGRFSNVKGPGVVFLLPLLDVVQQKVYLRTEAMSLTAENTMTRDAVAVTIDAVVFWRVVDPRKAVLEVRDFSAALKQIALTSLREMIGACTLAELLSERQVVDQKLRDAIEVRVEAWGLDVASVDVKDVTIPEALQNSMSRQAQAERERDARITLAEAEVGIAEKTAAASKIYEAAPIALQLRQMGLVYEMGKNGTTILIPTELASSVAGGAIALARKS